MDAEATAAVFLAFLLFLLGAATADALSDLPSMMLVIPFLAAELWLLGGAMVKVFNKGVR